MCINKEVTFTMFTDVRCWLAIQAFVIFQNNKGLNIYLLDIAFLAIFSIQICAQEIY